MATVQESVNLRTPIVADPSEIDALQAITALLAETEGEPLLLVGNEREVAIPPTLLLLLRHVAARLSGEGAVKVEAFGREVTLWEAADILGEPIEGVRQLIDDGELPARVADHADALNFALIKLKNILDYTARRTTRQTEAINELLQLSEEFGVYDRTIQVDDDSTDETR